MPVKHKTVVKDTSTIAQRDGAIFVQPNRKLTEKEFEALQNMVGSESNRIKKDIIIIPKSLDLTEKPND